MRYLDTSVIVAALGGEHWSVEVAGWLAEHSNSCVISPWAHTEYSSVVARKVRVGQFDLGHQELALQAFNTLAAGIRRVDIRDADFGVASAFVDQAGLGLRAPDALHLAIAQRHGAQLVTLDDQLRSAGLALELDVVSLEELHD